MHQRLRVGVCALLGALLIEARSRAPMARAEQAPAPSVGTIAGTVIDASTGDPIIEAGVEVVDQGKTARTDLDGKFTLRMAPGTYELRVFAPLYQGARLRNVIVQPNKITRADATLAGAGQAGVEVVEVIAQANRAAEATQLLQRKKAAVVSDTVSAEVVKKSPDSNAAEIVQRVPAVTIKDDKFIVVRGLGERYSSALLDGSRLPSTDPDKRVVPLDLFPGDFIESLAIIKTYTPDLPGDFSGGLANLELRNFPEKLTCGIGLTMGGNSNATFQKFNTYKGGGFDYFGFDRNVRSLPKLIGDRTIVGATDAQLQAFGRSLKDIWEVDWTTAPPNFGVNFSLGNTLGPLGIALAGVYTTEYKQRNNEIDRQFVNGGTSEPVLKEDDFVYDYSTFETRLGGVLTAGYNLAPEHRLTFRTFYNHQTSDEVKVGNGTTAQTKEPFSSNQTQLEYTEDALAFGQLAGEHRWPNMQLEWRSAFSRATRDVPDSRQLVYNGLSSDPSSFSYTSDSNGGLRTFFSLKEYLTDSAVDVTVPFKTGLPYTDVWSGLPAKLKFGPAYAYRTRHTDLRRFHFITQAGSSDIRELPPEELLSPGNITPNVIQFAEETQARDSFDAIQEVAAGYVMADLPLVRDRLRLVAGVRTEYSYITLETFDEQGTPLTPKKNNLDPLPGVNLIYSPRDDMNVRLGYSRAVSRPEFRELSPTVFPAPRGLRPVQGNPNLVQAGIQSVDLRWEWFFSPLEIVSLSFFYKQIDKPIEQVLLAQSSNVRDSFANADKADLMGFEFEGRKDLGFLTPALTNVSLLTNVAYIDSNVTSTAGAFQVQTSSNRSLQGQAPYVVNAALEYGHPRLGTLRLLYNTAGRRISSLGAFGLPDTFEERRDQVDLVFLRPFEIFGTPLQGKLAIENVLDDRYLFTIGNEVQQRYTTGVKVNLGLSYTY